MRGRRHKLQVSTFPFLAVLLCAMGSLILVLLVMDRKAHQASQARAQREAARLANETAQSETARRAERERLQQQARKDWEKKRDALHEKLTREQIEMQVQMRQVREQLLQIAARLHYEQDTTTQLRHKVQDEQSRLQAEEQLLRTLHADAKQTENQSKESSQALRRMTLDVLQMEQVLKDLQAARKREQKTFSVVPYHGRRGENRRPLYVECTASGIIFHPERKAMALSALIPGTADPANDVRAEVERRVARQRQKLAGLPGHEEQTPYLLLLLRPAGVTTYHLFQAALKGQDLEFGYEFIDDDWVLDFPADDELPSKQPWMIATKPTALPNPPQVTTAPSALGAPTRPMGMAPLGGAGGAAASGGRAFRGGVTGNWNGGVTGPNGSSVSGTGGGSGGTGPAGAGGFWGGGYGVPGSPFASGNGGNSSGSRLSASGQGGSLPASGQAGPLANVRGSDRFSFGNAGYGTEPRASASGQVGSLTASGQAGSFTASGQGGPLADARGSDFIRRGNGRGHPSAMPPSFPGNDGEPGFSGDGGVPEGGSPGIGPIALRGSYSGGGGGSGFPRDGPSGGGAGSDLPGLGPPRALSSVPGSGYPGTGTGGIAGAGSMGYGAPGSGMIGGGSAGSGNSGFAPGTGTSTDGRYVIARGNNYGDGPALSTNSGGGTPGGGGTAMPSSFGRGGSPAGTPINGLTPSEQGSVGSGPGGQMNGGGGSGGQPDAGASLPSAPGREGSPPGAQINNGLNSSTQAPGGSSSGTPGNSGGSFGGQPGTGAPMPANGNRSADVVIYVDPLTGKRTTPPRSAAPPVSDSDQERPPDEPDANQGKPRVRVIVGNGAAGGGVDAQVDKTSEALSRIAPTPSPTPPRRQTSLRPLWVHGGRDWTIYLECRAGNLLLYPSQRNFTLDQATSDPASNPLLKAIQQMIERRQSSRRPGEPPYHPQLCILVRPDQIRTFLRVYPSLEALPIPRTYRHLQADDDVIGIVTGAVP